MASGFPFGHGLSYTTFEYSGFFATATLASVTIKNTGNVAGAEIPQLYLSFPKSAGEPPKQLKGFQKTKVLQPGESVKVEFHLTPRDTSIWDVASHGWKQVQGTFGASIGKSSRDLQGSTTFMVGNEV